MPTTIPSAASLHNLPAQPRFVLVAEDEHLLAHSLTTDLTELGFQVVGPAPNGQIAVELAEKHKPDIALLDIRMPVLDGIEAAKILFEQMKIPVVILSAYSDAPYLEAGARIGVFGYLLKPVSRDELRVNLTVAWGKFRSQNNLEEQVEDLKDKLEARKVIEKAKGLLMKNLSLSEEDAMRTLQKQSRDSRRRMADLAQAVIDSYSLVEQADKVKRGTS